MLQVLLGQTLLLLDLRVLLGLLDLRVRQVQLVLTLLSQDLLDHKVRLALQVQLVPLGQTLPFLARRDLRVRLAQPEAKVLLARLARLAPPLLSLVLLVLRVRQDRQDPLVLLRLLALRDQLVPQALLVRTAPME